MITDPFDVAIDFVLSQEGEWSNDPRDPGKTTRWGISSVAHPDVDLGALTRDDAGPGRPERTQGEGKGCQGVIAGGLR